MSLSSFFQLSAREFAPKTFFFCLHAVDVELPHFAFRNSVCSGVCVCRILATTIPTVRTLSEVLVKVVGKHYHSDN